MWGIARLKEEKKGKKKTEVNMTDGAAWATIIAENVAREKNKIKIRRKIRILRGGVRLTQKKIL